MILATTFDTVAHGTHVVMYLLPIHCPASIENMTLAPIGFADIQQILMAGGASIVEAVLTAAVLNVSSMTSNLSSAYTAIYMYARCNTWMRCCKGIDEQRLRRQVRLVVMYRVLCVYKGH